MKYTQRLLSGMMIVMVGVVGVVSPSVSASYSADREYLDALQWMYQMKMTQYNTSEKYNPGSFLLREQAAKFFVQYAKSQGLRSSSENDCVFSDIDSADDTLEDSIIDACELGIIKGSKGSFNPKQVMTKAQALTVLVRIKSGLQDETTNPWWKKNFEKAQGLGLTKEKDVRAVDSSVTRYEMSLLLARAAGRTKVSQGDPELEEAYRLMKMMTKYLRTE